MARQPHPVVIDATARGPRGLWALEHVAGRSILAAHVDLVRKSGASRAIIFCAPETLESLRGRLAEEAPPSQSTEWTSRPPGTQPTLATDRIYDPRRLPRILRRQSDPERAVIWRLDQTSDLDHASAEWTRRLSYQPIGHVWAWPIARALARMLEPTPIRPNHLTLAACALMLAAAASVAWAADSHLMRILTASALALALVLDTADGRLARLQQTASAGGRWLDAVLDELADMALHAAIGWSLFVHTGQVAWLLVAFAYAAGKYLFTIARVESDIAEARPANPSLALSASSPPSLIRRAVHALGHADVRWHLWIVLALVGRLEIALVLHTLYFPARALAIARKRLAAP